jgi:hypothetical protein
LVDSPGRIELPRKGDYQMAIERLKFRCYRCNQLLAVAPNKAGTVVACPKCQADLLIPGGEPRAKGDGENRAKGEIEARTMAGTEVGTKAQTEPKARDETEQKARAEAAAILGSSEVPPKPAPVPSFLGELAGVFPPDLADLRPEDLRVEAEFFKSLARVPPPAATIDPAPWPVPESLTPSYSSEPVPPSVSFSTVTETPREVGSALASSVAPEMAGLGPGPSESPSHSGEVGSVVPQIEIEPPSILPPGTEIRRVSEVVLPAPVVLAWSLFVLVGIALSFVAGLMMGHFLWKTP